jgi:hypothetical protein
MIRPPTEVGSEGEMRGAREITGAVFAALEILHGVVHAFTADLLDAFRQPDVVMRLIGTASWFAFIAFAAFAFRQFSFRWLRVIAAFLAFLLLPIATILLFGRFGPVLPIEWIMRLPAMLTIVAHFIQLGIAGFIYLWSVRREQGSLAAASAEPAS